MSGSYSSCQRGEALTSEKTNFRMHPVFPFYAGDRSRLYLVRRFGQATSIKQPSEGPDRSCYSDTNAIPSADTIPGTNTKRNDTAAFCCNDSASNLADSDADD